MNKSILIIDDDLYLVKLLENYFKREGYSIQVLTKGKPALQLLQKQSFDAILCDIRLPDIDGSDILKEVRKKSPNTAIIMMTAYAEINAAVESIKAGAYDYITKPLHPEHVNDILKRSFQRKNNYQSTITEEFISGNSPQMLELIEQAKLVAPTDMSVLIQGETGSGKEYIARMIHNNSKRKNKKFIAIDCGAIPKELANSELFGHVKGSFTGSVADKSGYFEQANKGTIFLDEIGNLSYETQVKLLRAIQQKVITRVGDTKSIPVDVRIISATNRDLKYHAREGNFREDLYHRINEFKVELPALRDRGDDILLFANHFLKQANKDLNKNIKDFDAAVVSAFKNYSWHGNLRELRNVIKRSTLIAKNNIITIDCLPEEIQQSVQNKQNDILQEELFEELSLKDAANRAEKLIVERAMKEAKNNKSEAARILKIDRKTLYNKIKELGIDN